MKNEINLTKHTRCVFYFFKQDILSPTFFTILSASFRKQFLKYKEFFGDILDVFLATSTYTEYL